MHGPSTKRLATPPASGSLPRRIRAVAPPSRINSLRRGEMQHACRGGLISPREIVEIGELLGNAEPPSRPQGLVIFDTTGVLLLSGI